MPSGHPRVQRGSDFWFSVIFASTLVCMLFVYIVLVDDTITARLVIRFISALAAGLLAEAFLRSKIRLEKKIPGLVISATGGMAIFCLVFLLRDPASAFTPGSAGAATKAWGKQIEIAGTVRNAGQSVGGLKLNFQEISRSVETDQSGSFRLKMAPVRSVHVEIEGHSELFELETAAITRYGYFRLDVANPEPYHLPTTRVNL